MGHKPVDTGSHVPSAALDAASAATVAMTMQALATPSRLLILSRLRRDPCTVSQLAADVEMEQSAVSHQLRLLRNLGLVQGTRHGKTTVYALYDDHVARLLDEAVYHSEHLRLGLRDQASEAEPAALALSLSRATRGEPGLAELAWRHDGSHFREPLGG
ncbi:MAG TPA: helix-turn-helix domain-containing protein [Trebonia sp.]|nr:helix-turn-helix domain-containing protein [Trebonia sp.]